VTASAPEPTKDRILAAALESFGTRGVDATSLDALGAELGVSKQTILYWYPSKEALLGAVIDEAARQISVTLESALQGAGEGWERIEAVVRAAFRLGGRRPEVLGMLREVNRLGAPAAPQMAAGLQPLVDRATAYLEAEMASGRIRRSDPNLLLLAIYSTVLGMVTEVELSRALGEEPSARSFVRRRADVLALLRSALLVEPLEAGPPL
jgi:TetR/AcrR family transcriptional regulator